MKNLKYCRVGSAYRILPTTSGFCVRTALRKRVVQKSAQESYIFAIAQRVLWAIAMQGGSCGVRSLTLRLAVRNRAYTNEVCGGRLKTADFNPIQFS
ncbi:hypothetical protein SAMD00079811_61760 [Scytonema sp. HK-05]|uniref:hypothetical protein n=1 Tax=Scytonema sp. HK-05 TaxID=1137095 RepID=UPI00096008E4|nr:hypothetical protein [Scytonema sp. HK-05]OKH58674.1 hypothetical protein NIES2130_13475 [Scytonema sp. HK-05]BAY48551.1 hypothetical protein SAMD00079811_61760 [Scytonema sp. HK-05]